MATLAIGETAPAFSLRGIDGDTLALKQNGGRLTLAVFFKTTCPTCMLAWSYLEKIHQAYREPGLDVWGISQHDRARSVEFARDYKSTFPILLDDDWRVSKQYDPEFVPTLFLIDSAGQIIDRVISFDKAGLNRVSNFIAGKLGAPASVIAPNDDGNPPFRPG